MPPTLPLCGAIQLVYTTHIRKKYEMKIKTENLAKPLNSREMWSI